MASLSVRFKNDTNKSKVKNTAFHPQTFPLTPDRSRYSDSSSVISSAI